MTPVVWESRAEFDRAGQHDCPRPRAPWADCRTCDYYDAWREDEGDELEQQWLMWLADRGLDTDTPLDALDQIEAAP